jgi:hypothetical protein
MTHRRRAKIEIDVNEELMCSLETPVGILDANAAAIANIVPLLYTNLNKAPDALRLLSDPVL